MKKIIILLLFGGGAIWGLVSWLMTDFRTDGRLADNVAAFYKARGTVPASKEELMAFEQQMNLPNTAGSYRTLDITEPSEGTIRIVSSRGFILRSSNDHTFSAGRANGANRTQ